MTKEELKIILEKHEKWLKNEEGGECVDLTNADLRYAKNLDLAFIRLIDLKNAITK